MAHQSTMEATRAFEIETKDSCIFCLKTCSSRGSLTEAEGDEGSTTSRASLKLLFRYLEVNVRQLGTLPSASYANTVAGAGGENVEVNASVCDDCRATTDEFHRLFHELETIRLKLDKNLLTISGRIAEGNESEERVARFQEKMQRNCNLSESMGATNLVESLRKTSMEKCLFKVRTAIPRLTLHGCAQRGILFSIGGIPTSPNFVTSSRSGISSGESSGSTEYIDAADEVEGAVSREASSAILPSDSGRESQRIRRRSSTTTGLLAATRPVATGRQKSYERRHKCRACGSRFMNLAGLRRHTTIVHSRRRRFPCQQCPRVFKRYYNLNIHSRRHTNERPYSCEVCKKTFKSRENLRRHEKVVHFATRQHFCGLCSKAFKRPDGLNSHIRVHTKERPFSCGICSKSYQGRGSLWVHTRTVHSSKMEFACVLCPKAYKFKAQLENHIRRSHTMEKPFSCVVCKEAYTTSNGLYQHKRNKHGYLPVAIGK